MKISISKPPITVTDEKGNIYLTRELLPVGRMIYSDGSFAGYQNWIGLRRFFRFTVKRKDA